MSSIQTTTETEQIHFVNIISIAEDKLGSNFRVLFNRLHDHSERLKHHDVLIKENNQQTLQHINKMFNSSSESVTAIQDQLERCFKNIENLRQQVSTQQQTNNDNKKRISTNQEQIKTLRTILEDRQKACQLEQAKKQIQTLKQQVTKAYEMILTKQDSTEVLKLHQKLDKINEKCVKNDKDYSLMGHKIQKMEILGQKAERQQAQKDFQFIKEIDEKIKMAFQNYQSKRDPSQMLEHISNKNVDGDRGVLQEKSMNYLTENVLEMADSPEKLGIGKLNDRIYSMENKIKAIQKVVMNNSEKKGGQKEMENGIKLLEKVNEIKPELIKIWAKCDTLDDKIAFNERKMEEKTKMISSLVEFQKQNNWGKLQEKLKLFQTEMYATLKDVKAKVESKVSSVDYQKYCIAMDDRIRQLNQLIFLKSDKLEVKKALLFLESKLKQIILVISEQEQNEKDVLLTKKQLKCMSCDKDIDKIPKSGVAMGKQHWNAMPMKDHSPELLGKFGMTSFGSLSKRLKKLESGELPILNARKNRNNWDSRQNAHHDKKN